MGVTMTVVIDWTFVNIISLNHTLVVAVSRRSVSTLVFAFRSLSDVGIGEACCALIFGVIRRVEEAMSDASRTCVTITTQGSTYDDEDQG